MGHYTKPCGNIHNMNTGGKLKIVAGLINCRIPIWHYVEESWCGEAAVGVYNGPVHKALVRHRGEKPRYNVLEDNDPSGYKSSKAIRAKESLGIVAMQFPRYSPDLNLLDYFVWQDVESRMTKNEPAVLETVQKFKARLRRTALGVPEAVIRKGIADLKPRLHNCFENGGSRVTWD